MAADSFQYDIGPIRPPSEALSLLVRVSKNCPWNRCRFCTTYKHSRFEHRELTAILADIDTQANIAAILMEEAEKLQTKGRITTEALYAANRRGVESEYAHQVALFLSGGGKHVFLQDADSLSIGEDDFIAVLKHLYKRFPNVDRVTTYARSMTLSKVGTDALARIREAGLTRVHVGLESGAAPVLQLMGKGATPKVHIEGGQAAVGAGLELSEYVMPGVGGVALSKSHALQTARVINEIDPHFIRLRSFFPLPGSEMEAMQKRGDFKMPSEDAIVTEIRQFVEALDGIHSTLKSDHNRNLLMELEGRFPSDKPAMLDTLNRYLSLPENERLLFKIGRRLGYFQLLDDMRHKPAMAKARLAVERLEAEFGDAERGLLEVLEIHM